MLLLEPAQLDLIMVVKLHFVWVLHALGVNYTTTTGGVFSSNSSDLIVDPSTGEIDLVNSQPGNYDISYNVSSVNQLVLIFQIIR